MLDKDGCNGTITKVRTDQGCTTTTDKTSFKYSCVDNAIWRCNSKYSECSQCDRESSPTISGCKYGEQSSCTLPTLPNTGSVTITYSDALCLYEISRVYDTAATCTSSSVLCSSKTKTYCKGSEPAFSAASFHYTSAIAIVAMLVAFFTAL